MTLSKLDIYSVRNIQKASVIPSPGINLVYGKNASGKSAFLEAVFILGRAKSFRSASIKPVINFSQDHLIVSGQTVTPAGTHQHLGIKMDGKGFDCRINHQTVQKRASLAYALPLQLIHPKSYELLDTGPQLRREFLDWGAFNRDESFLPAWRHFKKALLQRNSLIKTRQVGYINVWDKELVNYGTIVHNSRQSYLLKLQPVFKEIFNRFLALEGIELTLFPGWDDSREYARILTDDLEKDIRYGFTQSGPHRADLYLSIRGKPAKEIVSRGQLKLLVISLKLAQVQLLTIETGCGGCILIDDFAAELDRGNRAKLLQYLYEMNCQVFITAAEVDDFGDLSKIGSHKMFHVEHGDIKPI
ncbi:MAG: DNA replication/repair protein RecF [Gammaproteobacteria bacterium]